MYIQQAKNCYECKNEIAEQRPTLSLTTEQGLITLCPSCRVKFNKIVNKDKNGTPMIRQCAKCRTIVADEYKVCSEVGNPDDLFWLCNPCYTEIEKEMEEK